jgi:hypothetical protein
MRNLTVIFNATMSEKQYGQMRRDTGGGTDAGFIEAIRAVWSDPSNNAFRHSTCDVVLSDPSIDAEDIEDASYEETLV